MTLKRALTLLSFLGLGAGSLPAAALPPERIAPLPASPSPTAEKGLNVLLSDYRVFDLPLARIDRLVRSRGTLVLDLGADSFPLRLWPNDLRGEGYRAVLMDRGRMVELAPPPLATFAGEVIGQPGSVVRLTVLPDRFEGYVRTDDSWFFIDPLSQFDPQAAGHRVVVYRQEDVKPSALGRCGVQRLEYLSEGLGEELPQKAQPQRTVLNLATDGDGEFVQRYGTSGALSRIQTIVNNVDGIYRRDTTLRISIVFQVLWSNPATDPYSALIAEDRAEQFQNYWNSAFPWVSRDNAHLFTGVFFPDRYIGVAVQIASVCPSPRTASYEVSEDRPSNFEFTQLVAHEIGHSLGAYHDNDEKICTRDYCPNLCNPSACGSGPGGTGPIMCTPLQTNGTNGLSHCSVEMMRRGSPCLRILPI